MGSTTTQTGTISKIVASRSDPPAVSTPPLVVRSPRASCGTQRYLFFIFFVGEGGGSELLPVSIVLPLN